MAVDDGNRIKVRNGDMIRLDANHRPETPVGLVDGLVATSSSAVVHQPHVGEGGRKGSGDAP